jgi:hypothetical protein
MHRRIQNFSLWGGGGGADPEFIYNLCSSFKKYFMKIISKSRSRHLVRLQRKLKLNEKETGYLHIR